MIKRAGERTKAVAYLRTSSAANVGADKDSERRQREAIEGFAKQAGYAIEEEFYDAAISGADHIGARPGFAAMLKRIESNGVDDHCGDGEPVRSRSEGFGGWSSAAAGASG
jgi:DNA invertase Pin-like site-specific DNA recombinase